MLPSALENAARAVIALDPVALAHVLDPDFTTSARRMDEMIVAEIDANVREGAAHRVEKHEVARFQLVARNFIADLALFSGRTRQKLAKRVSEYDLDKAAAIEAAVRVRAAEAIVDADEFQTFQDQILSVGRVAFKQGGFFGRPGRLLGGLLFCSGNLSCQAKGHNGDKKELKNGPGKIHGGAI